MIACLAVNPLAVILPGLAVPFVAARWAERHRPKRRARRRPGTRPKR